MSPENDIARAYIKAALAEAAEKKLDPDSLCRQMISAIVSNCLTRRTVRDVQSELRFIADNCDPGTDFEFMRP